MSYSLTWIQYQVFAHLVNFLEGKTLAIEGICAIVKLRFSIEEDTNKEYGRSRKKIYNQPIHKPTWMVDWAMDNGATPISLSQQVWWIDLGNQGGIFCCFFNQKNLGFFFSVNLTDFGNFCWRIRQIFNTTKLKN